MKRRSFLSNAAKGVVIPSLMGKMGMNALVPGLSPWASAMSAAGDGDQVLVLVYLNGGNDGLNTVVPLDQLSNLNSSRPLVALPDASLLRLEGTNVGLHPSLVEFKELFDENRLQIIQNVGYPDQNFSHFRSTDIWMSGSSSDELVTSGWAGRYLDEEFPGYPFDYPNESMTDPLAIEIGYGSSLMLQGPSSNMGMVIQDPSWFYNLVNNVEDPAPDTPAGDRLRFVRLVARQSQQYGTVVRDAADAAPAQLDYPENNRLAEQLKIVSRLIAGGLKTRVYVVSYGQFDTHDMQVEIGNTTEGSHAYQLMQVSQAIKAFMDDLDHLNIGDRVMGMTFSEFGRRIISNASYGTDHGSAAPLFLFGNQVAGGVLGDNPEIPRNATYADNLEMQYDFRSVYASIMHQWLCLDESTVGSLMMGDFEQLSVSTGINCLTSSTSEASAKKKLLVSASPNPTPGLTKIDFESQGGILELSILDLSGRSIRPIVKSVFPKGKHTTMIDLTMLPSGNYFVLLRQERIRQTAKLVKL